jgi:hypothetical protein
MTNAEVDEWNGGEERSGFMEYWMNGMLKRRVVEGF